MLLIYVSSIQFQYLTSNNNNATKYKMQTEYF